jgi:hypothetical protein
MRARELFSEYRQRIETLAAQSGARRAWQTDLNELLRLFEREATTLGPASTRLLCDELCGQLEHEALHTASQHRRDVLMRAIKGLEEISDRGLMPRPSSWQDGTAAVDSSR